jgi:hypothetical protein
MLLAFLGGIIFAALFVQETLERKEGQLIADAQQRIQQDSGWLTDAAVDLVVPVAPPVLEAFYDRFKADLPVYVETIDRQGKEMAKHLQATLKQEVRTEYHRSLAQFRKVVQEEFPEVTDRETLDRMMAHFEAVLNDLGQHYYLDAFRDTLDETTRLWRKIPLAPSAKAGEKALVDQLGDDLARWLQMKMVEADRRRARSSATPETRMLEEKTGNAAGKETQR